MMKTILTFNYFISTQKLSNKRPHGAENYHSLSKNILYSTVFPSAAKRSNTLCINCYKFSYCNYSSVPDYDDIKEPFETVDITKLGETILPGNVKLPYVGKYVKMPVDMPESDVRFVRCPHTNRIIQIPSKKILISCGKTLGLSVGETVNLSFPLMQCVVSAKMYTTMKAFYDEFKSSKDKLCYAEFEEIVTTAKVPARWFANYKKKLALETTFPDYISDCGYSVEQLEVYKMAFYAVKQKQQEIANKAEELKRKYDMDKAANEMDYEKFLKSFKVKDNVTQDLLNDVDFRIMLLKPIDLPFDLMMEAHFFVYPTVKEVNQIRESLKKELSLEREPTDEELYRLKGVCTGKKFKLRQVLEKYQRKLFNDKKNVKIQDGNLVYQPRESDGDGSVNVTSSNNLKPMSS